MKNIRQSVFETNSSSSHSISISTDTSGILDTIVPDKDGVITLEGGEFGWEWLRINDPLIKANYCAVDCFSDKDKLDKLIDALKEHTGAKEIKIVLGQDYLGEPRIKGYIDHDSNGVSYDAFASKETLKQFIFNPMSYLFTGNDNGSPAPNFYFYDVEPDIVYKYSLEVVGATVSEKFREMPIKQEITEALDRIMERHPDTRWDDNRYNDRFEFITWDRKDSKGNVYSSINRLDEGVIVLFKTKDVRTAKKHIGEDIVDKKELYFRIVKL